MTKIYALSSLFLFTAFFAQAQFIKGQKLVGGNVAFSTGKSDNVYNSFYTSNYTNVSVTPSLSWFTKANSLFGIGLSYTSNYQKNKLVNADQTDVTRNNNIGINFFSQRFFPLAQNFWFTLTATGSAGYSFGKQTSSSIVNNINTQSKSSGYSLGVGFAPGLTYKLTGRLLFDAYLSNLVNAGYTHYQVTNPTTSTQNNFFLSSSLSNASLGNVGLGFRWLLANK